MAETNITEKSESQWTVTPFEQMRITTMTLVISLNAPVDIITAFHLLPITRVDITQNREASKCYLPHCSTPGAILSVRFRESIRGVIRNDSKPFKNAVTIDISSTRKNISIKLSSSTIQMCGASSRNDGEEAAKFLVEHLLRMQGMLDRMQADPEKMQEMIEWVKNNTRGDTIEKPMVYQICAPNLTLNVTGKTQDHEIKAMTNVEHEVDSTFDKEILDFLLSLTPDFLYHSDFCHKLDYVQRVKIIDTDSLALKHVNEAMVNYNYSLGFQVDRQALNLHMDGVNGFISRYNNALRDSVTIDLIYEPLADSTIKRRKNKIPHHTFLIYRSGSVTQSGPGGQLMKDAYYLFMNTILEIRPLIMMPGVPVINPRSTSILALTEIKPVNPNPIISTSIIPNPIISTSVISNPIISNPIALNAMKLILPSKQIAQRAT